MSERLVALLRAVNVGKRAVPMGDLAELVESLGYVDVSTHLRSGNVLFATDRTERAGRAAIAAELAEAMEDRYGFPIEVVLRDREQLLHAIEANPFPVDDPRFVHIAFLSSTPDPSALEDADPERFLPDRYEVSGDHAFLHYPNGSGRSKMTLDKVERMLGVSGTARNLNTVAAIAERL